MKNTLCFLLGLFSTICFAQKSVDAMIVKANKDTIYTKLKIQTNMFDSKLINEASFYKKLVLLDNNGKKTDKLKAKDISKLKFTDLKGEEKVYIFGGAALQRLMFEGKKISWYKMLSQHWDGSIQYFDYLVDSNNIRYEMGLFNSKIKKLKAATASKPELIDRIENTTLNDQGILEILTEFEKLD